VRYSSSSEDARNRSISIPSSVLASLQRTRRQFDAIDRCQFAVPMQIARGLGFLNISRKFGVRRQRDMIQEKIGLVRTALWWPRVCITIAPRARACKRLSGSGTLPNLRVLPACASFLQTPERIFQCGVKAGFGSMYCR